jgi:hypothetical protein
LQQTPQAPRRRYRLADSTTPSRDKAAPRLAAITSSMLAAFRDKRLKTLSPQTVVPDLNLLSRIFRAATIDWGISLPTGIPTATVRKPSINNERSRRLIGDEEVRLLAAIDNPGPSPGKKRHIWTGRRPGLPSKQRHGKVKFCLWTGKMSIWSDVWRACAGLAAGQRKTKNPIVQFH